MRRLPLLTGKLLLPVDNGLNFHQARESAAEAACVGIPKEFSDFRQALARVGEQMASDVQANLGKHFAVTRAHAAEMTLQRPRADFECAGGTIESSITVLQRRDNGRANRPA